ncbi:Alpha/Beta hydrolase protein [Ochromonadaceae sp. CCMP2298]|nr:Alpha/Beta hydrolase protein [Ochromonadaceae sp. CCMP2298]
MSKRRGKLLTDAESLERRGWYQDMQRKGLAEVEEVYELQRRLKSEEAEEALAAAARAVSHASVELAATQVALESNEWVRLLNQPVERTGVVVCLPGIGQNHTAYQSWGASLEAEGVQLCAVCLPGRSNRASQTRYQSVQNCATAVFLAMRAMGILERLPKEEQKEEQEGGAEGEGIIFRPLILVGNSIGAMVAFEVARHLQNYRYHLSALFAAGAPSAYVQGLDKRGKKWCFLSDQELLDRMIQLGGVPPLVSGSILRRFVPLFRGDYYLMDKYELGPPAMDGFIKESELRVREEGVVEEVRKKHVEVVKDAWVKKKTKGEEEEEEDIFFPVALYRLKIPLVTIRALDDVFATPEMSAEWQFLTSDYEHIELEEGTGGHFMSLFHPHNRCVVLEEVFRFCKLRT